MDAGCWYMLAASRSDHKRNKEVRSPQLDWSANGQVYKLSFTHKSIGTWAASIQMKITVLNSNLIFIKQLI